MKGVKSLAVLLLLPFLPEAQTNSGYWNHQTQLVPWRFPVTTEVKLEDLDGDGDPDIIRAFINDSIPVIWIDDDDDMKTTDFEGDTDNDCLLADRNRDGIFAGPSDFSLDRADENRDGIADIQIVAQNGAVTNRYYFDWNADFMIIIDREKDNIQHFINWNELKMEAWEHNGHSRFYEDYHGNTLFQKMHASTFRIGDLRYSWENPFLFYDPDHDGLTEWTIRLVDTPHFRQKGEKRPEFAAADPETDVLFTRNIDWTGISWDLDNDNGQGNEFDFDMSLRFTGPGFSYADQVHHFKSLRGLEAANYLMYDSRWRKLDELVYPDHQTAWDLVFNKGKWTQCRLVFDEDDDCNRWERVEFYDPGSLWISGEEKGGLDHNKQADATGDRGEFDMDNSGNGQLYVSPLDGRIHLYGAEWGAWRIDQTAYSFQGFGGLYDRWKGGRLQRNPAGFATLRYTDTDHNGFFDQITCDLNGDTLFEENLLLKDLAIADSAPLIRTHQMKYDEFRNLFREVADHQFNRAMKASAMATKMGVNTGWYAFWMHPRTLHEKYEFGYWLNFYIYRDMRQWASSRKKEWVPVIDKAYYSGQWELLNTVIK